MWPGISTGSRIGLGAGGALEDVHARDFAVRDYRHHLKEQKLSAASVNAALAAVDHLLPVRGARAAEGPARSGWPPERLGLSMTASSAALFRAGERRGNARDRAVIGLLALAGLRLSELAGLDVDDVAISARKGTGDRPPRQGRRHSVRATLVGGQDPLEPWLRERRSPGSPALFVRTRRRATFDPGTRPGVGRIGEAAGVELSPHVLRHTFVTRLVRSGTDVVVVAELAGHRSLRRPGATPCRPQRTGAAAVERLAVER